MVNYIQVLRDVLALLESKEMQALVADIESAAGLVPPGGQPSATQQSGAAQSVSAQHNDLTLPPVKR